MYKKAYLKKKEQLALSDFKKRLEERLGGNFLMLELFGSRARGEKRRSSDIDIAVITKRLDRKIDDVIIETCVAVELEHDIHFEMLTFAQRDYNRARREQWPLILNMEREAVIL